MTDLPTTPPDDTAVSSPGSGTPTHREATLLDETRDWTRHTPGAAARAIDRINGVTRGLVERALAAPAVASAIDDAGAALLDRVDVDRVQVPPAVAAIDTAPWPNPDERAVALEQAEQQAAAVDRRHRALLTAQGALSGAAGSGVVTAVAALVTDVAASTAGLLNATVATLAAYGHTADLRGTALRTLLLTGESDADRRRSALVDAAGTGGPLASDAALGRAFADQAGIRTVNQAVESVLRRRVQQRAVVVVPVLGAVAGGATSAFSVARTCAAARHVGRLHLLARHLDRSPDELLTG